MLSKVFDDDVARTKYDDVNNTRSNKTLVELGLHMVKFKFTGTYFHESNRT